ncbi:MmgE/PrpD family protein [Chelatococcus asaccharovorans]|uniref:MmgE/PrpD family protein n=1 Tax=Chelatococcus asaccharovorans TaxID=28210 RepID=UPI00224C6F11|nr:MmgE/PrpD family protein [Chelatococcus asaccharovorans]CAH1649481.1 Immune-responsive protein 1 [Chelatococcus asaccharovorans]CAH1686998.1 Immune-responsive protein 1 [Chelatococcus asaccharovorans]
MTAPAIADVLAQFVCGLTPADIPAVVMERARHLILDGIGTGIAARARGMDEAFVAALTSLAGAGACSVVGHAERFQPRDAALLNGLLIHSLEFDDTHMGAVLHPTATAFAAALAAAEMTGAADDALVTAYVAGLECSTRVGALAPGAFQAAGFHPTGVVGIFSAALAAGKLLGLTVQQLVDAQGLALSMASGSMQFLRGGGVGKRFHAGWAAQAGLLAASLAREGIAGAQGAFEGQHGLFASFTHAPMPADQADAMLATLRTSWETLAVAVKPFPAAYYTHACIEAAIDLALTHAIDIKAIARVEARVPPPVLPKIAEPKAAKAQPASVSEAQFALPFLVATALAARRFGLGELTPEQLADPAILDLARRVTCMGDATLDFPRYYGGAVTVVLDDDSRLTKRIAINLGAKDRPVDLDFILTKFAGNCELAGLTSSEALATRIGHDIRGHDIRGLVAATGDHGPA